MKALDTIIVYLNDKLMILGVVAIKFVSMSICSRAVLALKFVGHCSELLEANDVCQRITLGRTNDRALRHRTLSTLCQCREFEGD